MSVPTIITLEKIKSILKSADIFSEIEKGFVAYSQGKTIVPPVSELLFSDPPGDVHIKSGYLKSDEYYVVKIASNFSENFKLNLPSNNGLMLLFDKKTGQLLSILLDEGYLTDIRTAVAGAIAAKYLAPKQVNTIGIIGTGIQAKLQLEYLKFVRPCRQVIVWGRNKKNLVSYRKLLSQQGFSINITERISDITQQCNLIVTTTPSKIPLLNNQVLQKGTHITAVGADTSDKQELGNNILAQATKVVADSIAQCAERGEIAHAVKAKIISLSNVFELGDIIAGKKSARESEDQITIADLTGVAVQDLQIAKLVYSEALTCNRKILEKSIQ